MNFAERLTAGPPVLATVGRRAQQGDVVVLTADALEANPHMDEAFEVIETYPAIVGQPGVRIRSLLDPGTEGEASYRAVTVLTKPEAKAARAHYADIEETSK